MTGLVASTFDLLHAGHCLFLKEAKSVCDFLYVALQTDPTVDDYKDRPLQKPKNNPIQSLKERKIQLEAVSYVDEIIEYTTEQDLNSICKRIKPNIRVLGSDYRGKHATGQEYSDGVIYHHRNHDWSTSELRERVTASNNC
ncbi:MAG TPA: glycerol-3-phosphate cytidylyltransferase [Xanthomarina gelatinilytica]|nr:glycerol-3-phosphate cytidylyltransferase [Xanthomarina gelatinilytica]